MVKQMDPRMRRLRLEQVQASVAAYSDFANRRPPPRGWLKVIRESLGLTERQQADRLGITGPTLHKSVVEERARSIALQEVSAVAHTMSLEDQRPATDRLRKQVDQRTVELLRGRWSDLWR